MTWSCSSKYANCTLDGTGTYKIPQLLQDNGKTQTFNAIWITNTRQSANVRDIELDKGIGRELPHFMSTEELFASFNQTYVPGEFLSITDADIIADYFPMPDNVLKMTKEEELRRACFPGYFTPDQITLQDIPNRNSEQVSMANPLLIKTIIIVDTEAYDYYAKNNANPTEAGCYAWANNILEGGDDMMEIWFGVDFQAQSQYFRKWDSPNHMGYLDLLNEIYKIKPWEVDCDVIVLMTGQSDGQIVGYAKRPGNHFVMSVNPLLVPLANLFQHEASHLFGCYDSDPGLTDFCIMSYTWFGATRNYCKSGYNCYQVMLDNRYRFD